MDGFVAVHFFGWWIKVCNNLICPFKNLLKELNAFEDSYCEGLVALHGH